jgi:hypothetical protein
VGVLGRDDPVAASITVRVVDRRERLENSAFASSKFSLSTQATPGANAMGAV